MDLPLIMDLYVIQAAPKTDYFFPHLREVKFLQVRSKKQMIAICDIVLLELQNSVHPTTERNRHLDIALEDKRSEDYLPPAQPTYTAFSGIGAVLKKSKKSEDERDAFVFSTENCTAISSVDDSRPIAVVQVRSHQGKKVKIRYEN